MKLALFFVLVSAGNSAGLSAKEAADKVSSGLGAAKDLAEVLSNQKNTELFGKLAKVAGDLAPFLGAIGPAISIISLFLPSQPSAELQYMKEQFSKVNDNFDKVFSQFGDVKNLIRESGIKNQYGQYAFKIVQLSERLEDVFKSTKTTYAARKKLFLDLYKSSYQDATDVLWRAMMGKNPPLLSFDIPKEVMTFTENDRPKTQYAMKGMTNLIIQGMKVQIAYLKMERGLDSVVNQETSKWVGRMTEMNKRMQDIDKQVKNKWNSQVRSDMLRKLGDWQSKNHQDFAYLLYNHLKVKYNWREFCVVSYKDVRGFDNHIMRATGGHSIFSQNGRNLVVQSLEKPSRQFLKSSAQKLINLVSPQKGGAQATKNRYQSVFDRFKAYGLIKVGNERGGTCTGEKWVQRQTGSYYMWLFGQ